RTYITPEPRLADQAIELAHARLPVGPRQPPETAVGLRVKGIARREARLAVSLALEGQEGIGARLDATVDPAGEVYAQEGKLGVRHRVDQVAHQAARRGLEIVVFAAGRDDTHARIDGEGG